MVYPECATPNPDGARFCSSCGAPLEGASSVDRVRRLESYLPKGMLAKLETAGDPLVHPLLGLWEPAGALTIGAGEDWLARHSRTVTDSSVNARSSSALDEKEYRWLDRTMTLSVIERVLFLRQVSLFADLSPADLGRVASIADELSYSDGEVIAAEGELGQELHIVVEGTLRVTQGREESEHELARRTSADVVGEMSIIT
jgi:hypothetical protein